MGSTAPHTPHTPFGGASQNLHNTCFLSSPPSGLSDHCPVCRRLFCICPSPIPHPQYTWQSPMCTRHAAAALQFGHDTHHRCCRPRSSRALPTSEHHLLVLPPLPAAPPNPVMSALPVVTSPLHHTHHPARRLARARCGHAQYACARCSPPAPHASMRHHPLTAFSGPSLSPPTTQYHPPLFSSIALHATLHHHLTCVRWPPQ